MLASVRNAICMLLALTVLVGVVYPLAITGISILIFPKQSRGSIVQRDGSTVGSELIGQWFTSHRYFWGRPSATSPDPYTSYDEKSGGASAGSNLAASNPDFIAAVKKRAADAAVSNPAAKEPVPVDLATASGSGLDPHISIAAAKYQIARVAAARGLPETTIAAIVDRIAEGRQWGVFGEPRVNVLALNLALDESAGKNGK
ncbi:MAG: potassium-transporting ATPase subunit KdpC [Planctomycetes bacterium]|nr:potassium-transporting ATPase subunit KdpC [Planctomycetota bacterium]